MFSSSRKLDVTAPDDPNAVIALLEAKVKNLTAQLQQQEQQKKDAVEKSNGSNGNSDQEQKENATISQLTEHLDEKNGEINTLKARLADQAHGMHNLKGRLAMALAGKSALNTQLMTVEKQRADQSDRLDVLQNLTKVQAEVVEELNRHHQQQQKGESGDVTTAIENGDYTGSPNEKSGVNGQLYANQKSGMHGQLYKLMTHSSELNMQLEEQTKQRVAAEEQLEDAKELNEQLKKDVEKLTSELAKKQKPAKRNKKDKDNSQKGESEEQDELEVSGRDEDHLAFLLPEMHQLLDSFNDGAGDGDANGNSSSAPLNTGSMSKEEQRQHLQTSLQVYQTQVKRLQQDVIQHWDKTARVSVALAEAKANIDDLEEKVDYYETILESLLGDRLHSYHLEQAQKKQQGASGLAPPKTPDQENTGLLARFFRRVSYADDGTSASSVSSDGGNDLMSLSSDTTSDFEAKRAEIQKKLSEKSKRRAKGRVKKRQQVIHRYLEQIEQDHGPSAIWGEDSNSSMAREGLEEVALEEEYEGTETEEYEDEFLHQTGDEMATPPAIGSFPPALERNLSNESDGPRRVSFATEIHKVSEFASEVDPEKRMKQVKRKSNTRAIVDPFKNKENNGTENEAGAKEMNGEDGEDEDQDASEGFEDSSEEGGDFMKEYLREAGLPEKPTRKIAHPWNG